MFAKVVVDIKSNNLNETFSYHIPDEYLDYIFVGSRVLVSFGMRDVFGYVLEINEKADFEGNLKDIKEVFDFEKELNNEQVELAKYLSEELNAPLVSTLDLMMPSFLKEQKKRYLYIVNYDKLNPDLALLFNGKRRILIDNKILEFNNLIRKEINKKNIQIEYDFLTYGRNKKVKVYYSDYQELLKSGIRTQVLEYVKQFPRTNEKEIQLATNVSKDLLNKMVKDNQLQVEEVTIINHDSHNFEFKSPYKFNFDQQQLLEKFRENGMKPYLLFSNDEEFKANFYMQLIADYQKQQKQIVIFAPTIMLAEEISLYLEHYLDGLKILTYHSKNTKSENYDIFMNVKYENFSVLVTTSLGVFLPYTKLGLVIVLDEDNPNYIIENFPYYDIREVLKKRTSSLEAKIIFSSSTPSINTFYQVQMNKYYLLEYNLKRNNQVTLVDMKEEILEENNTVISKVLHENIKQALSENRISMLIVNNKSFSTEIKCRDCGTVLKCPKCNIPLILMQAKGIAKCNYCDYKTDQYKKCKCGSENMISLGFGLEQVKQKVSLAYPTARIIQVDSDNIKAIEDYNNVLTAIEENTVDIIIGTNFLTKTLNYDNIKVVGLLYVDSFLNINDHRGAEYTYNLIAKMTNKEVCVVQTYNKKHYAIKYGVINDYDNYYENEISNRELLNYEPFLEMNRIIITGPYDKLFHFAYYYRKAISRLVGDNILGPSYDYRVKGVKLIIKHNKIKDVIKVLNDAIRNFNDSQLLVSFERYPKGM